MLNPLLRNTIAYTLGIFCVFFLPELPNLLWAALLLLLSFSFRPTWRWFLFSALLGVGFTTYQAQQRLANQLPESWMQQTVQVSGHIHSRTLTEGRWSVSCAIERVCLAGSCQDIKFNAKVYGQGESPQVGDDVVFEGVFKHAHRYQNPGGRDMYCHAFLRQEPYKFTWRSTLLLQHHPYSFASVRARWLDQIFADTKFLHYGYVIPSILFGVRSNWDPEVMTTLRETGTGHLFAISGMHIALAFRATTALASYATRRLWLRSVLGLGVAFLYAALAGFAWPTVRAIIMLAFLCFARTQRSLLTLFDALTFAWLVILLMDPFAAMEVSFWLSFCAVGLIGVWPTKPYMSKWWKTLHTQYRLAIGMAPLIVGFFGQYAWISPITNLFAVPWFAATTIPLSLLGALAHPVWPALATLIFEMANATLWVLFSVLGIFAKLPFASSMVYLPPWGLVAMAAGAVLVLWPARLIITDFRQARYRKYPPILGISLIALACLSGYVPRPSKGTARVTMVDVGQGLSVVVETHQHCLVFDTGPKLGTRVVADQTLIPFQRHQHIRRIDALVVSHADNDHSGGLKTLLQQYPIDRLYTSFDYPGAESCHQKVGRGMAWIFCFSQWEISKGVRKRKKTTIRVFCKLRQGSTPYCCQEILRHPQSGI
ncbi:MAG: DNA internalization-related competence protein ComEC/Rec2 [Pseudomonadota bacterium]